ncbi:hypothetical protein AB3R30_26220 [Leptolyngbyaceae cyanobacterium UHCC 1019]
MTQLPPDTKIETPTGRRGVVVISPGSAHLPLHCLVLFPSGDRQWLLAEILTAIAPEPKLQ